MQKGFTSSGKLRAEVKAGPLVAWLKQDIGLGHGHAMATVGLLKGMKTEGDGLDSASILISLQLLGPEAFVA